MQYDALPILITELQQAGVTHLELDAPARKLRWYPVIALPDDLKSLLRAHKAALLALVGHLRVHVTLADVLPVLLGNPESLQDMAVQVDGLQIGDVQLWRVWHGDLIVNTFDAEPPAHARAVELTARYHIYPEVSAA